MTGHDCKKMQKVWSELAQESEVSELSTDFEKHHLEQCEQCRKEKEWVNSYKEHGFEVSAPPLDDLASRRFIDAALSGAKANSSKISNIESKPRSFYKFPIAGAMLAAGLLIVLGIMAIWYSGSNAEDESLAQNKKTAAVEELLFSGEFMSVSGEVQLRNLPASQGATLVAGSLINVDKGQAVVGLADSIELTVKSNTEIQVRRLNKQVAEVVLNYGLVKAEVESLAGKPPFVVTTRTGKVVVTGTEFQVSDTNNQVWLEVYDGTVRVEVPGRTSVSVKEGFGMNIGGDEAPKLLQPTETITESTEPFVAREQQKPGIHDGRSTQELLRDANKMRMNSNWQGAANTYKILIQNHPRSEAAQTSRVSLGLVQLKHLNKPTAALRSFDRYLKGSSQSLATEAMFGKSLAYRALGKQDKEIAILSILIKKFPQAIQSRKARKRLATISELTQQ